MITTTYECDRCGHQQDSWEPKYRPGGGGLDDGQRQMLEVGVYATFNHLPQAIASDLTRHKVHWCRQCVDAVGLDPVQKKKGAPPPELTLEDQIREIVRAEVESHG